MPFKNVDVVRGFETAKKMFRPGSSSFCHYTISKNGKFDFIGLKRNN
jgi:hypothetical protein